MRETFAYKIFTMSCPIISKQNEAANVAAVFKSGTSSGVGFLGRILLCITYSKKGEGKADRKKIGRGYIRMDRIRVG